MAEKTKTAKGDDGPTVDELTALVKHLLPDADIDELVKDVVTITRRDGTTELSYIGDASAAQSEEDDDAGEEEATEEEEEEVTDGDSTAVEQAEQVAAAATAAAEQTKAVQKSRRPKRRKRSESDGEPPKPAFAVNTFGDNTTSL